MSNFVRIGEFSRLTHLSQKKLRHYHECRLLVPSVDPESNYRLYALSQVPDALLIARLRDLDMPIADIRGVIEAGESSARSAVIAGHLRRMEQELDRTRDIVASLRELLTQPPGAPDVRYHTIPDLQALSRTEIVRRADITSWCATTYADLYGRVLTDSAAPAGPGGALYGEEFFTDDLGPVTAYVPVSPTSPPRGATTLPGHRYAIAVHCGPFSDFDRTYAALGTYVAERGVGTDQPIREIYRIGPPDVIDDAQFRTDVCWPVTS